MMTVRISLTRASQEKPVGELLWLAVTAIAFAVVMGIVCWPLSAALMPRLAASDPSASRGVSIAPVPDAGPRALPSPTYIVTPLPLPEVPPLQVDQTAASETSGVPALALGAAVEPSEVRPSTPVTNGPTPAARRPQQTRSDPGTRTKFASPAPAAPTLTPPKVNHRSW